MTSDFKVKDRQTFIEFIIALRQDFMNDPNSWENKTLSDFLKALSSYTEDIQGYYDNTNQDIYADKPDWKTFADLFKGASM